MCRRIGDFFHGSALMLWVLCLSEEMPCFTVCILLNFSCFPGRVCSTRTPTETQLPNTAMESTPQSSCLFESCTSEQQKEGTGDSNPKEQDSCSCFAKASACLVCGGKPRGEESK